MKITDVSKLHHQTYGGWVIPDEYLVPEGYSVLDHEEFTGMKAIGRVYFRPADNLDYTTGEPVEMAYITGGEKGVTDSYLKPGARVFTEEQVINLLNSRCYESNEKLKPKLPEDVYEFLEQLADNTAKMKPIRARAFLSKYKKEGFGHKKEEPDE